MVAPAGLKLRLMQPFHHLLGRRHLEFFCVPLAAHQPSFRQTAGLGNLLGRGGDSDFRHPLIESGLLALGIHR
ncbi:hypothetical protein SAMN06265795_113108 [Noviherbaspirillum humi]|uniref:Uncharacterized protein n=1 Tax=Noviherbaspirillum humi TaxID=1688639 RepID=A0A239JUP9_9BURK|nr:hypothetical protein [Noviherbaspirillum humi]SNT09272.1 hypothetical protein SAMN06265795_113108 [Noviherbaspirillum humi]